MMAPMIYKIAVAGLGNVGSSLLDILHKEEASILKRYGVKFLVTGVAELGGGAINQHGLDLDQLIETLAAKKLVSDLPEVGRKGMQAIELIDKANPDFLLEATPVNLQTGQPGLDSVRVALKQGIHVVLANKGPVAIAFSELATLSDLSSGWGVSYGERCDEMNQSDSLPALRFSACVAGSLPSINLGSRDLAGCQIQKLEAVFNGTTQYIIRAMEQGHSYDDALADAQRRGIAETDPTLDVDGWDASAKLVIATNSILGQVAILDDVDRQGIRELTQEDIQKAATEGLRIVPLCSAELVDEQYKLSVKPTALPLDHPLARITADEMGVAFYSRDVDCLSAASSEPGPEPAAAAMLRDMLDVIRLRLNH
jgi:homoserine dehydrogenase